MMQMPGLLIADEDVLSRKRMADLFHRCWLSGDSDQLGRRSSLWNSQENGSGGLAQPQVR